MQTQTLTPTASFQVVREINGSTFSVDKSNNISKVSWQGEVDLKTAQELLDLGANSVEHQGFTRLIVDRSGLSEFDTEARLWIKDLLKTRARRIAKNVEKLAIINASTAMGSIFSNMMATAIGVIIPNLKMKKFDDLSEAERWLLEDA